MIAEFATEQHGSKRKQKRKSSDQVDKCKRKHRRKEKKMKDGRVDLISQLPDHIIHQILSFLRCKKDVARTSVLSQRWKDIWASFLILDFDERNFQMMAHRKEPENMEAEINKRKELFRSFVNSTLQSRIEQGTSIRKISFRLTSFDGDMATDMNKWIRSATQSNVQELDLHFPGKNKLYTLSQNVFTVETLTALTISGCNLKNVKVINLPNLRKIILERLHIREKIIQDLTQGCPLLEDLRLIHCSTGFRKLLLSSDKLRRVDLHLCRRLHKVELRTSNLEKFWYHHQKFWRQEQVELDLASCSILKSLMIELPSMKDDMFQNLVSKLPVLEQLSLSKCNKLKTITVSSHRLTKLILRDCKKLKEADIDTPNLISFEYKGKDMPFLSMNPSGLKEASIYLQRGVQNQNRVGFCDEEVDRAWFAKLQKFLGKFDHFKGLKLVVRSKKILMVHEDMSKIVVPPIYDLKLDIIKPSLSLEDLFDNVLRKWHPSTLFLASPTITEFPEKLYDKLVNKEKKLVCCSYNTTSNKCWRHFLKGVKAENISDISHPSDWTTWLKSHSSDVGITLFALTWAPSKGQTKPSFGADD